MTLTRVNTISNRFYSLYACTISVVLPCSNSSNSSSKTLPDVVDSRSISLVFVTDDKLCACARVSENDVICESLAELSMWWTSAVIVEVEPRTCMSGMEKSSVCRVRCGSCLLIELVFFLFVDATKPRHLWRLLKTPPDFFDRFKSRDLLSSSDIRLMSSADFLPNRFFSLLYLAEIWGRLPPWKFFKIQTLLRNNHCFLKSVQNELMYNLKKVVIINGILERVKEKYDDISYQKLFAVTDFPNNINNSCILLTLKNKSSKLFPLKKLFLNVYIWKNMIC